MEMKQRQKDLAKESGEDVATIRKESEKNAESDDD